jgi:hypothetical protein
MGIASIRLIRLRLARQAKSTQPPQGAPDPAVPSDGGNRLPLASTPNSRRETSLKRIFVAFLLLAALMIPVGSAGAATQAKQIKTLQKQMKTM